MQQRDSFQRQKTGMLQRQAGTRPLNNATKPLLDPEQLRAQSEDMLGKAKESLGALEARVELLLHACRRAGVTTPGVESVGFKHPLSPKGEQIVGYLAGVFTENKELAKAVAVGIFRYHEAVDITDRVAAALGLNRMEQALLEELRLKLFYLTRFHADFRGDRVLSQLFPAPATANTGAGPTTPLSTVERLKLKQAREAVLHKAEILRASLKPKMEILDLTLQMLQNPKGMNIGALFTPQTRTARLLTMGLAGNHDLIAQLAEARRLFDVLEQQLHATKKNPDVEPLKHTLYPLGRLAVDFHKHPLLKDIFPLGEQDLFPPGDDTLTPSAANDPLTPQLGTREA